MQRRRGESCYLRKGKQGNTRSGKEKEPKQPAKLDLRKQNERKDAPLASRGCFGHTLIRDIDLVFAEYRFSHKNKSSSGTPCW